MTESSVLVVEDDQSLLEALCDTLELGGFKVHCATDGAAALALLERQPVGMVVSDVQMKPMDGQVLMSRIKAKYPDLPVLLMTAYGTIQKAVAAMRDGAADYLVKPFEAEVLVSTVARYLGTPSADEMDLVGKDRHTHALRELARRVADSSATVLITGESGTGKEVLARYLHRHSPRVDQPFVAVNCAAIPENMLEATLFGYEKGAFTGAYQAAPGKFEQAQGGTLLLDEISEMDLGLQAKLLRVLQEREVERLGGRKTIQLDVRVLATSNRDMKRQVTEHKFREDLFYRLNVFPLQIAPLRERVDDIIPLTEYLLERHARDAGRAIPVLSEAARKRLLDYCWPGNVRELDNVIQRALILQGGDEILAQDLHLEQAAEQSTKTAPPADVADTLNDSVKSQEYSIIVDALREPGSSRKAVAARLGISERTLRYKLAKMRDSGIEIPA
ncbi:MAG TPA: sigma-54-dependent Fis family transcriptional regulator [Gammaproteobacteria bacterium]|nr:sigma-54-dependent Fis family transcriptional regulator [Gammaproteobacteria bacterium]